MGLVINIIIHKCRIIIASVISSFMIIRASALQYLILVSLSNRITFDQWTLSCWRRTPARQGQLQCQPFLCPNATALGGRASSRPPTALASRARRLCDASSDSFVSDSWSRRNNCKQLPKWPPQGLPQRGSTSRTVGYLHHHRRW